MKWEFRIWCIICSCAFLLIIFLTKKFPLTTEINTYIEAQINERDGLKNLKDLNGNTNDPEAATNAKQTSQKEVTSCLSSISIFPIDYKKNDGDDVNMDLQHLSLAEIYDIGKEPATRSLAKNTTISRLYYSNLFSIAGLLTALAFVSIGIHFQIQQPASSSLSLLGTMVQIIVVLFLYELFRGMSLNSLFKLSSELLNTKAAALSEKLRNTPSDIKSSLIAKDASVNASIATNNASAFSKTIDLLKPSQVEAKIFTSKYFILGFPFEKYSVYYFCVGLFSIFWIIVGIIPFIFFSS